VRRTKPDVGFYKQWEVVGEEKRMVNYFCNVDWEFFFGMVIVRCGLPGETTCSLSVQLVLGLSRSDRLPVHV